MIRRIPIDKIQIYLITIFKILPKYIGIYIGIDLFIVIPTFCCFKIKIL